MLSGLNKPGPRGYTRLSERDIGPEDRQLIIRVQGGERAAFDELVRRYRQSVYRASFALVGNVEDAMDATQDAFIRAFRAIGRFDSQKPFFPWIYKIVRNLSLSCLQKRKRGGFPISLDQAEPDGPPLEVADRGPGPREECSRQELEVLLSEALESLGPEDREIIVLRDLRNYSYKDIAALLEIPIGTVMSRLYYARDRLRKKMEKYL